MKRVATIALGLSLLWASAAQAGTTIVVEDGSPDFPYQQWVNASRMPTPDVTLTVSEGPCSETDAGSCTYAGEYQITMAAKPSLQFARRSFLHELGHNFDYYAMTDEARVNYMRLRGLGGEWVQRALGVQSPHERFAEDYKLCARWYHRVNGKPRFGPEDGNLPPRRMAAICRLIRSS